MRSQSQLQDSELTIISELDVGVRDSAALPELVLEILRGHSSALNQDSSNRQPEICAPPFSLYLP